MFLLDTNIVSEIVKRAPQAKVLARLNNEPSGSLHQRDYERITGLKVEKWFE